MVFYKRHLGIRKHLTTVVRGCIPTSVPFRGLTNRGPETHLSKTCLSKRLAPGQAGHATSLHFHTSHPSEAGGSGDLLEVFRLLSKGMKGFLQLQTGICSAGLPDTDPVGWWSRCCLRCVLSRLETDVCSGEKNCSSQQLSLFSAFERSLQGLLQRGCTLC